MRSPRWQTERSLILIVDDDDAIRSSFRYFLDDTSYAVIEADDGKAGLAAAEQQRPDLALLDLRLPGISGLEVLSELQCRHPQLPVIVISATGDVDEVVEALRRGAWDFLIKPIHDLSILLYAVRRALERARLLAAERRQRDWLEREVAKRTDALRASEEKYRRIFASLQDVYCEILPDATLAEVSPSVETVFGYRREELLGKPLWRLGLPRGESRTLFQRLNDDGRLADYELSLRDRSGVLKPCAISARLVRNDDGSAQKITGMLRDISKRKRAEAKVVYQAYHDDLTGLPNRLLLFERLRQCLAAGSEHGALLFIDLDHFKTINDSLGHAVGDALLTQVADRLRDSLHDGDTAARIGGDEFVLLLRDLGNSLQAANNAVHIVAEQLRSLLTAVFKVKGFELYLTPSIGIALYPTDAASAEDLLQHADIAMYRAKATGRNATLRYDPAMSAAVRRRLTLEQELREAVSDDQLRLYFQPLYDAAGTLLGGEALLRWQHPQRGLILPGEFVPLAEETGQIIGLGDWVLAEACHLLGRWRHGTRQLHGLSFAVNISPRQFQQRDLAEQLRLLCAQADIGPELLKLELTEQIMIDNVGATVKKMRALRRLGVGFAIDDFGTGYSSLSYLRSLPVDTLKIDRSFVREVDRDASGAGIVETILTMARHLNLEVVAEGVESAAELRFLVANGCRLFQGFHFSPPLPAEEFGKLLPVTAPAANPARTG